MYCIGKEHAEIPRTKYNKALYMWLSYCRLESVANRASIAIHVLRIGLGECIIIPITTGTIDAEVNADIAIVIVQI